jgi:hypothetical protein
VEELEGELEFSFCDDWAESIFPVEIGSSEIEVCSGMIRIFEEYLAENVSCFSPLGFETEILSLGEEEFDFSGVILIGA